MTVPAAPIRRPSPARERLLRAALARFDRDGALGATLEEIRAEAGVSVGALYHHFADKRALAGALYVETLAAYHAGFLERLAESATAESGIRGAVEQTLDWCAAHPAEARLLFGGGRGDADPAALADANRAFFARGRGWYATHVHYGALRELPFPLLVALWLGPTLEYLRHALREPRPAIGDDVRRALADAAWAALATPAEKEPR